jgi:hypothetical protein
VLISSTERTQDIDTFYNFLTGKDYIRLIKNLVMSGNIQKSSSLNRIVEDITNLKQRLEYFEIHVHNIKNEEVGKEYFRTLGKVLEAEESLHNFAEVFNSSSK